MPPKSKSKTENSPSREDANLKSIDSKLDLIISQLASLNKRIDTLESNQTELTKSVEFLSLKYEEIKDQALRLQNEVDILNEKIGSYKSLENRIEAYEYLDRAKCIELNGIPHSENEDLFLGLDKLLQQSKITTINLAHDIDKIYRIRKTKRVIVKFITTTKRDSFFSAYRKNIIDNSKLGFKDTSKIYINEVLSSAQSQLYWQSRNFKKQHNYKYIWTFRQRIYLRKTAESDAIEICKESDLDAFCTT